METDKKETVSGAVTLIFLNTTRIRGLSNVQIGLHSCCVVVLDVFFLLLLCFYILYSCHVSTVLCHITTDVKALRPMWPRGQIIRPQPRPRPHSLWTRPRSRPHGIWPRSHRNWHRGLEYYSAHDIN